MDKRAVKLAIKEAARFGVTSVHDLDGKIGIFKELLDEGELTVRIYAGVALTSSPEKLLSGKIAGI
jgi:predicted amidohydrolase YtcJ